MYHPPWRSTGGWWQQGSKRGGKVIQISHKSMPAQSIPGTSGGPEQRTRHLTVISHLPLLALANRSSISQLFTSSISLLCKVFCQGNWEDFDINKGAEQKRNRVSCKFCLCVLRKERFRMLPQLLVNWSASFTHTVFAKEQKELLLLSTKIDKHFTYSISTAPWGGCHYPHFTDWKIEAWEINPSGVTHSVVTTGFDGTNTP